MLFTFAYYYWSSTYAYCSALCGNDKGGNYVKCVEKCRQLELFASPLCVARCV